MTCEIPIRSVSYIINAIEFRVPVLKSKCCNITLLGDGMVSKGGQKMEKLFTWIDLSVVY